MLPETIVPVGSSKVCFCHIERYLMVKLKTVGDFWRSLARLGGFIGANQMGGTLAGKRSGRVTRGCKTCRLEQTLHDLWVSSSMASPYTTGNNGY